MAITAQQLEETKAKLEAKKGELAKLTKEVSIMETELVDMGQQFLASMGIAVAKKKASVKSTGSRWQAKGVIRLIAENNGVTRDQLLAIMEKDKPGANTSKLDEYLEQFTTNKDKLVLNAAGKKLV
jgi:hypothetical protein